MALESLFSLPMPSFVAFSSAAFLVFLGPSCSRSSFGSTFGFSSGFVVLKKGAGGRILLARLGRIQAGKSVLVNVDRAPAMEDILVGKTANEMHETGDLSWVKQEVLVALLYLPLFSNFVDRITPIPVSRFRD